MIKNPVVNFTEQMNLLLTLIRDITRKKKKQEMKDAFVKKAIKMAAQSNNAVIVKTLS